MESEIEAKLKKLESFILLAYKRIDDRHNGRIEIESLKISEQ